MQKLVIKLTDRRNNPLLIGTESIISVTEIQQNAARTVPNDLVGITKIQSRGAMVETYYVKESIIEIFDLINAK